MGPIALSDFLKLAVPAGLHVLVSGKPGIGKTQILKALAEKMGWDLFLSHPAVDDPVDYKGLPWFDRDKGIARFFPIGVIQDVLHYAGKLAIWFIDDVGQAPLSVQAALMQWVDHEGRELNGMRLPDNVVIVMATNRREDRAGVSGFLEPFKSRCIIVELETDTDAWIEWALTKDIDPRIIAYIASRPQMLNDFHATPDLSVSPSPRGWARLDALMKLDHPELQNPDGEGMALSVFSGAVGQSAAAEFISFANMSDKLPSPRQIEDAPTQIPIPVELSERYATVLMLAHHMKRPDAKIKETMTYMSRFSEEFRVLWTEIAPKYRATLTDTPEFTQWAIDNQAAMTA